MGRRRNELRNAADLILDLHIIVAVRSKIQFLYANFSAPPLWLVPLTSFALATALVLVFGLKLGEDQKKVFTQILSVNVLKLSAQITKVGGPCRNFAYYYMLIILSWRPKGGSHGTMPPLNTPLAVNY